MTWKLKRWSLIVKKDKFLGAVCFTLAVFQDCQFDEGFSLLKVDSSVLVQVVLSYV